MATSDGGGVRGYSSLLILRRLMCIIADLESGKRNDLLDEDERRTWVTVRLLQQASQPMGNRLYRENGRLSLMPMQYDSSADYPWRNPPEDENHDVEQQNQQVTQDHSPPEHSRSDQQPMQDRNVPDASLNSPPSTQPSSPSSSFLSRLRRRLSPRHSKPIGAAQNDALPGSQISAQDSNSSDSAQSKPPKPEEDSRGIDHLVRFRVNHYFDYVAGTSTGG